MKRCDEFYRKAKERENWPEDDMCCPPTTAEQAMDVLIDEMLGEGWCSAMPQNGDQTRTQAVYEILDRYVDRAKQDNTVYKVIFGILVVLNIIQLFL